MSLTGNLTGEAKKRYLRDMAWWVGLSFFGMFLGLVAVGPDFFHMPTWGWLRKTFGVMAFIFIIVGSGFYEQYRWRWKKRGE